MCKKKIVLNNIVFYQFYQRLLVVRNRNPLRGSQRISWEIKSTHKETGTGKLEIKFTSVYQSAWTKLCCSNNQFFVLKKQKINFLIKKLIFKILNELQQYHIISYNNTHWKSALALLHILLILKLRLKEHVWNMPTLWQREGRRAEPLNST